MYIDVSSRPLLLVACTQLQQVGCVSIKNTKNILIKNIGDASLGAICWWLFGYGVAFGETGGERVRQLSKSIDRCTVLWGLCEIRREFFGFFSISFILGGHPGFLHLPSAGACLILWKMILSRFLDSFALSLLRIIQTNDLILFDTYLILGQCKLHTHTHHTQQVSPLGRINASGIE